LSKVVQDKASANAPEYALVVADESYLAIGEFSRRTGVSADLLRVWERRYGLPRPARTANGRRMYSRTDELVVDAIRRAMERGIPAAEAARLAAISESAPVRAEGAPELGALADRLRDALSNYDEALAQDALDRLFGAYGVETALSEVILPYVREVGERWACDEISIADEHFATSVIHGRLLSLARKWDAGRGPSALLACPAGELHTIGLLSFGLALRAQGWRITYLGADTPAPALARVAARVRPTWVVLSSVDGRVFHRAIDDLAELAAGVPTAIGGAGASPSLAAAIGAELLPADLVRAADELGRAVRVAAVS
jgi:DNA-binding transcriptional MerR regulator